MATAVLGAGVVVVSSAASAPLQHRDAALSWPATGRSATGGELVGTGIGTVAGGSGSVPVAGGTGIGTVPVTGGIGTVTAGATGDLSIRHGLSRPTAPPLGRRPIRASRGHARAARPAFARPTHGRLTTCFCVRWGVFHDGIDLAAPMGTPIYAAAAGVVTKAGPASGYGNLIEIRHAGNTFTFYGHEEAILVRVGQHVQAGQRIALVGNRGFSTGPHLHFGVRVGKTGIDPIGWLRRHGIKV